MRHGGALAAARPRLLPTLSLRKCANGFLNCNSGSVALSYRLYSWSLGVQRGLGRDGFQRLLLAQGFLSNLEQNLSFPVVLYKARRLTAQTIVPILLFLHNPSNEVKYL